MFRRKQIILMPTRLYMYINRFSTISPLFAHSSRAPHTDGKLISIAQRNARKTVVYVKRCRSLSKISAQIQYDVNIYTVSQKTRQLWQAVVSTSMDSLTHYNDGNHATWRHAILRIYTTHFCDERRLYVDARRVITSIVNSYHTNE